MRLIKLLALAVTVGGCLAPAARADLSAELADLAARIDYGFYNDDARSIEAALTALERLGDSPAVSYTRDFAALRLAQLAPAERAREAFASDCAARDVPADAKGSAAAELWILAAACAELAHSGRRVEQALAHARDLDDDNPRIALVEAWALQREFGDDAAQRETLTTKWQDTVAGFDTWNAPLDAPQWGHAEALAVLGELKLLRGEARAARDLIERALLLAPDYAVAVVLRRRMQGNGAATSKP